MSFKRKTDKGLNKFGNTMADIKDVGKEIERAPEHFVKGSVKGSVGLAKLTGVVGVGVLKELSGIAATAGREITGTNKRCSSRKSNLAKGWFE